MASKAAKKKESANRVNSASKQEAASIAASVIGSTGEAKKHKPVIWPEFSDTDINQEKWDTPHKGKEKDKGKSPNLQHFFEDPEGRIDMPPSLKQRVDHWKRPQDFILDKTPVVFEENAVDFDLMTANEHIQDSELMRWITSQIATLWCITMVTDQDAAISATLSPPTNHMWKPWEHIYSMSKVGKGPHVPMYNPHGKYVVKLYWMGVWRKIVVDDTIPYDDNEKMLLPATTLQHELWPMLLAKALIKVASLDYNGGSSHSEFGDVTVIHCLTGWLPETIPLQCIAEKEMFKKWQSVLRNETDTTNRQSSQSSKGYGHINQVWDLLKILLPEFKLPELEEQKPPELDTVKKDPSKTDEVSKDGKKDDKAVKEVKDKEKEKAEKGEKPGKEKEHKEDKKDKKEKDKDKDKHKDAGLGEAANGPQVAIYVSYDNPPKVPVRVSLLGEMADASERLRQSGLSHVFPHPLLLTRTRSCPLVAPPPPPVVPAWKLIRQKKKKTTPHDQAPEPEIKRAEQWIEVTSPYVNYKVSPIPIPTDVKRPKSSLSRGGGSRPSTALMGEIVAELDEDHPERTEELLLKEKQKAEEKQKLAEKEAELREAEAKAEQQKMDIPPKPDTPSKDSKDGKDKKSTKDEKKDGKREKSAAKLEKIEEPKGRKVSAGLKKKESSLGEKAPSLKSEKTEKSEKITPIGKDAKDLKDKDSSLKPSDGAEGDAMSVLTETASKAEGSTNEGEGGDDEQKEKQEAAEPVQKDIWMHFEDFAKCFKTLYIFHKPNTYICNHKMSDLRNVQPTNAKTKSAAPGGPAPVGSMTAQTPARQPFSPSPQHHHHAPSDERQPQYMFVDNLEPTEIIVSFSALSRWLDPPPEHPKTSHSTIRDKKDRESDRDSVAASGGSLLDVGGSTKESHAPVSPGLLVAEPYSWKSLVVGQPILRIRSTSTRAAALSLPPGRHVLRFMMNAPLGYHIHLCSTVNFVFGDEETVMTYLTRESCRFVDHANQVMLSIKNFVQCFDDQDKFTEAMNSLALLHYPVNEGSKAKAHNFEVFNEALYTTLRSALGENFTLEMVFAWKAFNFDVLTRNVLGTVSGSTSRPEDTHSESGATGASRKSAKAGRKPRRQSVAHDDVSAAQTDHTDDTHKGEVVESWVNREATEEEIAAATRVQKHWRGYYVRKIRQAREPGTEENSLAKEQLVKSWALIEQNWEQHALTLFRTMFKIDPELMPKFPFYQDEWNKISYSDYQGNYPDQPPNTWFVVFRDVFYVQEPMLLVPKLYVSIPTCMLRVVDNDTGEEIPRVFQRVAPFEYKRNKRGYTFVAEARTTDMPLAGGKWRMRMIGSLSPLPQPMRENLNSTFNVKEIRDYYIPNDSNIILRYSVKVTEDQIASVQLSTSKLDVYILLQILDNEVKVTETIGKGHVVIPAFTFLRDREAGEDQPTRRSSSRASQRGGSKLHTSLSSSSVSSGKKRQESAGSRDGRTSRGSRGSGDLHRTDDDIDVGSDKEQEPKPHKYIIQAKVLRKSWPLSESSWAFVQVLKDLEKNDLKANKDRPISAPKSEKAAATQGKGGGKKGKDKGKDKEKDKDKGSRPPSQQFDNTKPNWVLRVVLDQTPTEEIEIKKDTERQDEIRAMKQAWEAAEPGRAAKAQELRRKFLEENMIKVETEDDESKEAEPSEPLSDGPPKTPDPSELEENPADMILTNEPPPPPLPKEILREIDKTQFIVNADKEPRLLDEEELRRQQERQQCIILEYRALREKVLEIREEDRKRRNASKEKQIEECEKLQAALDAARKKINEPREAFREKFLAAERKRLEEIAAQEAALKAEQEKSSPSPKGRKSAKGKKSAGKKRK